MLDKITFLCNYHLFIICVGPNKILWQLHENVIYQAKFKKYIFKELSSNVKNKILIYYVIFSVLNKL